MKVLATCTAIALLAPLLLLPMISASYTPYSPAWETRIFPRGPFTSRAYDVVLGDGLVYVVADIPWQCSGGTCYNSTVASYYASNGSLASYVILSYTGIWEESLRATAIAYDESSSVVYVAGYNTQLLGSVGWVWAFAADNLGREVYGPATLDLMSRGYWEVYLTGICLGGGHVYVVGYAYNVSGAMHAIVASFKSNLTLDRWVTYYSTEGYNLTADSCAYMPETGRLYVAFRTLLYHNGTHFPESLIVAALDPGDLSILDGVKIPLYNSEDYLVSTSWASAGIAADPSHVYVAFTYADELPSPKEPSSGASVAALDPWNLSDITWRRNLTTGYWEGFTSISVLPDGSWAAAGFTMNDYGSGLGTSYSHALVVGYSGSSGGYSVLVEGATDNDTIIWGVVLSQDGTVYAAGSLYSDRAPACYNVTSDANIYYREPQLNSYSHSTTFERSVARLERPPEPGREAIEMADGGDGRRSLGGQLALKVLLGEDAAGPPAYLTPSGNSSAYLVDFGPIVDEPQPIPEPGYVAAAVSAAVLLVMYRTARRRLGG